MPISENLSQNASAVLSAILEVVNCETESAFRLSPMASGAKIEDCRLLEVRTTYGSHGFTLRFSEDLIFQIVDLMAGGASCHFTKIIEKPFTGFELSTIDHLLLQALGVRPIQIIDLGKSSKSTVNNTGMNNFGFTVGGPKSEGIAYVMPSSISSGVLHGTRPNVGRVSNSVCNLDDLQLDSLAEVLRYELPQTCALALRMMNRDSAASLLKILPWELQQDVGVRFITMKNANTVAKDLLVRACQSSPQLHLKRGL